MRSTPAIMILVATTLLPALGVHAVAQEVETVKVSFSFPDGSSKMTTLTDAEVRSLLHENFGYMIEWWVRGSLVKLDLPHRIVVVDVKSKAKAVVPISGVENGPAGSWVLYVNGLRSPYHINTQLRTDVHEIRLSYEPDRKPAG